MTLHDTLIEARIGDLRTSQQSQANVPLAKRTAS